MCGVFFGGRFVVCLFLWEVCWGDFLVFVFYSLKKLRKYTIITIPC